MPIIETVFRAGETYAFLPDITEQETHKIWIEFPRETYIATGQDNKIQGTLPNAFNSRDGGYVDALIMYKQLKTGTHEKNFKWHRKAWF